MQNGVCTSTGKSGDVAWGLMEKEFALRWAVPGLRVVMISYATSLSFTRGNFPPIQLCLLPILCLQQVDQTCCVPEMTLAPPHCVSVQKWTWWTGDGFPGFLCQSIVFSFQHILGAHPICGAGINGMNAGRRKEVDVQATVSILPRNFRAMTEPSESVTPLLSVTCPPGVSHLLGSH